MKKLIILGGGFVGLAILAILAIAAFYIYELAGSNDPNLATEAPAIVVGNQGNHPATESAQNEGGGSAGDVQHFVLDPRQSSAKFVVHESLNGVPDVTALGTTSAMTGDVYLTPQGLAPSPKSTFKVDLNTLKTDEPRRDNSIKRSTLQVSRFPTAEFTIDSVTGFPASYVENTEVSLTLTGNLTLHGVTRPVTWQVKARQSGDKLTATADTDVKMTDFGMQPPDVGFAKAKNDVHLQVIIVSQRQANA